MFRILKEYKKFWLGLLSIIILLILLTVILVVVKDYLFLKKEVSRLKALEPQIGRLPGWFEEEIERKIQECQSNFDLDKLDFRKPIWESETELSVMLPDLIAMQAFEQNNKQRCDYFKETGEINQDLTVENCQRRYYFLNLVDRLKEGMSCQNYIEECQKIANLDVKQEEREQASRIVCESLCQSYQNKTAVILDPENLCDAQPSPHTDAVNYLDPKTNQLKTCFSGIGDKIKFLIAVARNDPAGCLTINDPQTSLFCQFYFNQDLTPFQNKFKDTYCRNLVEGIIRPPE